jgi:hypothetical protein
MDNHILVYRRSMVCEIVVNYFLTMFLNYYYYYHLKFKLGLQLVVVLNFCCVNLFGYETPFLFLLSQKKKKKKNAFRASFFSLNAIIYMSSIVYFLCR